MSETDPRPGATPRPAATPIGGAGLPPGPEKKTETPEDAAAREAAEANKLSPEEQLARFEDDLKEKDWGHQPC